MNIDTSLSQLYYKALMEVAEKNSSVDEVLKDAKKLDEAMQSFEDCKLLFNTNYQKSLSKKIWDEFIKNLHLGKLIRNFIKVLIHNKRLLILKDLYKNIHDIALLNKNIQPATLFIPSKPNKATLDFIQIKAEDLLGFKISIDYQIKPELLAGFVLDAGSRRLDASLEHKLYKLNLLMQHS